MRRSGVDAGRQINIRHIVPQCFGIIFLVAAIICWAAAAYALEPGDAKASARVNLRKTPSLDGEILVTIPSRYNVRIIQTKGLWCRVEVAGDIYDRGWVFARYLKQVLPKALPAESPPPTVRVETARKKPPQDPPPVKLPPRFRLEAETARPVSMSLLKEHLTSGAKEQSSLQNPRRDAQRGPVDISEKKPVDRSLPEHSPVAEPDHRPPVRSASTKFKRDAVEISAKRASKLIEQAVSAPFPKRIPNYKKKPEKSARETVPAVSEQPLPDSHARSSSATSLPVPHETKGTQTGQRSIGVVAIALKLVSIVLYGLVVLLLYKKN